MNAALRQTIRLALDQRARAQTRPPAGGPGRCAGCGTPYDSRTDGCRTCESRHRGRTDERRARQKERHQERWGTDPAYRERRRAIKRLSRAAARERAAA